MTLSGRFRQKRGFVDEKLSGCGTHMEHIVSVHDLFLNVDVSKRESLTPEPWKFECLEFECLEFESLGIRILRIERHHQA